MRYIARALKYFFQVSLTLVVILLVLMALGLVSKDINILFRGGWKSVEMIALMFGCVSALYPLFGYARRALGSLRERNDVWDIIDNYMRSRGYTKEKEIPGSEISYRADSLMRRIMNLGEDRITFNIDEEGDISVEGRNREVMRIYSSLVYTLNKE